jgi:hypothetical protein
MKKNLLLLALAASGMPALNPAIADETALPGEGFTAAHYETLWTKSPFSVATPEASDDSPDYTLVGITQLEGVAYASVVDAHTGDHFLISSDQASRGLKLISITHSTNGTDTFAQVQKDGQPLTLKLQPAAATPAMPNGIPGGQPPVVQNIPMPTGNNPGPGFNPPLPPRSVRIHRPVIHLPPTPVVPPDNQPVSSPMPGLPVQNHQPPPTQ